MIKIEELLEAGVHFGHKVTKWNPRMAPFIFGQRNNIHIIDLIQTIHYLKETTTFLKNYKLGFTGPNRLSILFVGTKKQASASIERVAIKTGSSETLPDQRSIHTHYVNHRWLGGLLTNWTTMKICIDLLNSLEEKEKTGQLEKLPKKEQAVLKKQYQKLNTFFGGIKTLKGKPNIVIIVGQDSEMNAVRECQKLQNNIDLAGTSTAGATGAHTQLRTITMLDTNCDPLLTDLFIPANDDSTKSIDFILNKLSESLIN
jgi:small subunit ribosomal protein S2